jgi:hypothetical protein
MISSITGRTKTSPRNHTSALMLGLLGRLSGVNGVISADSTTTVDISKTIELKLVGLGNRED